MKADTADLKRWTTARAQLCRLGILSFRSDPQDGPRAYFTVRHGVARMFPDLEELESYLASQAEHLR